MYQEAPQNKKSVAVDDEEMDPTVWLLNSCFDKFCCLPCRTVVKLIILPQLSRVLQQYFENRLKYLASQKADGKNPYPHKFQVSMSLPEYIEKYGSLSNGDHLEDVLVSLAGT